MSEKPEALRLADAIDPGNEASKNVLTVDVRGAAAELRRLHAECGALRAKAARYDWLRDHPLWRVDYRIRPGKSKEWRMRDDEGDWWGNWWPTHEQAVDHWIKEQTK